MKWWNIFKNYQELRAKYNELLQEYQYRTFEELKCQYFMEAAKTTLSARLYDKIKERANRSFEENTRQFHAIKRKADKRNESIDAIKRCFEL